MDFKDRYQRLQYLKELLEKQDRLSPKIIARKFECSPKTARNLINYLRDEGYNIYWNKRWQTYQWLQDEENYNINNLERGGGKSLKESALKDHVLKKGKRFQKIGQTAIFFPPGIVALFREIGDGVHKVLLQNQTARGL